MIKWIEGTLTIIVLVVTVALGLFFAMVAFSGCATNLTTMEEPAFDEFGNFVGSTKITQRSLISVGASQIGNGSVDYEWTPDGGGNLSVNGNAEQDGNLSADEAAALQSLMLKVLTP